ncbi:hypothetical protein HNP72_001847 [Sphingobacterium soli]|nr:hypothetical protein [Sphingobacterium soli]
MLKYIPKLIIKSANNLNKSIVRGRKFMSKNVGV